MTGATGSVVHVPEKSRFERHTDSGPYGTLAYERGDGEVTLTHTVVPTELEGQGVGSELVRAAIAWAHEEQLRIVPVCSFVQGWLERHPGALDPPA